MGLVQLSSTTPVKGAANAHPGATRIRIKDVLLSYGNLQIIGGISLDIRAGEAVSIIGPSGCGKTTLLRMIAGLALPTSGVIELDGTPILGPRPSVAIVFQDYGKALLPWRTATGNVALALEARGCPRADRPAIIRDLLEKIGLGKHADKYPNEMSGGMQQRLQIARCLAQQPSVLLMDEPFGALDAMTRQSLQDEVLELIASTGATMVFVTHDLEEAIYLGDRIVCLQPNPGRVGRLVDVDLSRPRDQLTSREDPEFLRLRRELYDLIKDDHQ